MNPHVVFDLHRDHKIGLQDAVDLAHRFQAQAAPGTSISHAFHRSAFDRILAQPGCAGIRAYQAKHADGSGTLVLVGVTSEGEEMMHPAAEFSQNTMPCPPFCAFDSVFQSSFVVCGAKGPGATPFFDAHADHAISLEAARAMVRAFQAQADPSELHAVTFNHSAFDRVLRQEHCVGMRLYLALHEDLAPTLVLVGVDAQGQDIAGPSAEFSQFGTNCPPFCHGLGLGFHEAVVCRAVGGQVQEPALQPSVPVGSGERP